MTNLHVYCTRGGDVPSDPYFVEYCPSPVSSDGGSPFPCHICYSSLLDDSSFETSIITMISYCLR